ncbi:MAG: FMN-binding negative transcriptional regulator [Bacteroidota bacterium]
MYNLPYFKEKDAEIVKQFMREHPFAFLCGCDARNRPVATQVPVFIDEKDGRLFLTGHMMKSTDHQKAFLHNPAVLAVFTGPHTYVSASWYENQQQGSTWNYMSVHAKGSLRFLDEQSLLDVLRRTTNHFENNPHSGANFENIPADYIEKMVKAIVAFEIEVKEMDNVFKLSQNRDEKSYDNIAEKLKAQGGDGKEIAELMEKGKGKVFNA